MLQTDLLLAAFEKLGSEMLDISTGESHSSTAEAYEKLIGEAHAENRWFIPQNIKKALANIGHSLTNQNINAWLLPYNLKDRNSETAKVVGIVMAGNIPLVGFHDFLCVLFSGHKVLAKLSSDDRKILPFLASRLFEFYPDLKNYVGFTEEKLEGFDAIIATGSNNTSRYFEYYFGKYPHIIRKNRNGVAVISGHEKVASFGRLGEDVFLYFGLGCRNVSKLYVPEGYDFIPLLHALEEFGEVLNTSKYKNNYDYYRSIYLINKVEHLDNGVIMITPNTQLASPLSVLHYEEYKSQDELKNTLNGLEDEIQCIVSEDKTLPGAIPFGQSQKPHLWDYADGLDTMVFLMNL